MKPAALPDVLVLLDMSDGTLVSVDVLGGQPTIDGRIRAHGRHYPPS